MSANVGSAHGVLTLDTSGFNSGFQSALSDLRGFEQESRGFFGTLGDMGERFTSAGTALTRGLTLPIVGAGTAITYLSADMQTSMNTIESRTRMAAHEVGELERNFRDMATSGEYGAFTAREVAAAYADVAVAGQDSATATDIMRSAMIMATATGNDLGDTAYFLGNYLLKVGKDSSYAEQYINIFSQGVANTGISLADMQNYMFRMTPAFEQFGASTETNVGIMTRLYQAGIRGANLYSGMGTIMMDFGTAGEMSAGMLERFNIELVDANGNARDNKDLMFDLAIAMRDYEDQTYVAQQVTENMNLAQQAAWFEFMNLAETIQDDVIPGMYAAAGGADSMGTAFEMAAINNDGMTNSLQNVRVRLEEVGKQFGDILLPIVVNVTDRIGELLGRFMELDQSTQQIILIVAAAAAAAGPLLLVLGKLMTTISKIPALIGGITTAFKVLAANPIILVIGALVAMFAYLMATNEEFRESIMGTVRTMVEQLQPIFERMMEIARQLGEIFMDLFRTLANALAPVFEVLVEIIAQVIVLAADLFVSIAEMLVPIIERLAQFIGQLVEALAPLIVTIMQTASALIDMLIPIFNQVISIVQRVINALMPAIEAIMSLAMTIIDLLVPIIQALIDRLMPVIEVIMTIVGVILDVLTPVIEAIVQVVTVVIDTVIGVIRGLIDFIVAVFTGDWQGAWEAIKGIFSTIWEGIKSIFQIIGDTLHNIAQTVWNAISGFLTNVWNAISNTFQTVWNAISNFFTTIGNAISNTATNIWNAISNFLQGIWNSIRNAFQSVWNAISSFFSNISNAISNTATNVWNAIRNFLTGIWNGISNTFTNVGNTLRNTATNVWNAIRDTIQNVWNNIVSWFTTAVQAPVNLITNIGSAMFNAGKAAFQSVWDGMRSIWDSIVSWVNNAVNWLVDRLAFWRNSSNEMSSGSYASGIDYIHSDRVVTVHEGEAILTKQENEARKKGQGSGGDTFNFYSPIALTPSQSAAEMKRRKQELAMGFA